MPQASSKIRCYKELLRLDLRPTPYEAVFAVFALTVCTILYTHSPLPLSWTLATFFLLDLCKLVLAAGILGAAITLGKLLRFRHAAGGWPRSQSQILEICSPYLTLDWYLRNFRRGFSILGVIYFFLHLKHVVLFINPSNHDLFFWNLDRKLHFGVQPNIWLMQTFGSNGELALLVDWLYIKYFDFKVLVSVLFLLELKGRLLTERYFFAYALLWSIGGLAYLVAPTDGPCYAILGQHSVPPELQQHVFQFPVTTDIPPSYEEQYQAARIWNAKIYQEDLWKARFDLILNHRLPNYFYGIAAMPSLHVAAVAMIFIFLCALSSVAGFFGAIYFLAIWFGSVFLQWHYAVDGYAGLAMAIFASWLSFRLVRARRGISF
ncbi:MAG: phosphatase PAP2 family protein [Oligoflexia bacterium]|nr:phosphatase PAP2 family protein [Oligoflexia bacterium]